MARNTLAKLQDDLARRRAQQATADLSAKLTGLRLALESATDSDQSAVQIVREAEEFVARLQPDFTTATVRDGVIQFGGGHLVVALAGQMAAFLADADANNYRTGVFTIGPATEGAMVYEFCVQRVAPGTRTPAQKNADLMAAAARAVDFLEVRARVEAGTIVGGESAKMAMELREAMA